MDRMYRFTRHVYDASRKYYLLGRDRLIAGLKPAKGEIICEVGCGTARNLIKMAHLYPDVRFVGLDASDEMLKTAKISLKKNHLDNAVTLAQAYAQSFDPASLFALTQPLDKIVFSYALSIIPPWRESIDHALTLLPPGGEMHIVDFGGMDAQPLWFRKAIFFWLALFHVYHKPEILSHLKSLEAENLGQLSIQHLYRGYAYIAIFKKS
ncbi:MAG: class I SAM-dependent methyltransferase [Alphaproteobacteria bacterium]|nr:class I SAM-dependent methyltransferase [Alphaproteobacteria bacterium]